MLSNTQKLSRFISQHWLAIFLVTFGLWNFAPFLAPVFMKMGWESGGKTVYTAYAPFCHQMAQRSFFMFGEKVMYNADELPVASSGTSMDMVLFRRYRGDEQFGWKVAWSDRMVYMYGSIWVAALVYAIWRQRHEPHPLSIWIFGLLLLPMALDGGTHFLSDLSGLTHGFRYTNEWLATLTNHAFSAHFYAGDNLGSFNSIMRLISGVAFGIACVWFVFPYIDQGFFQTEQSFTRWDELQNQLAEEKQKLLSKRQG